MSKKPCPVCLREREEFEKHHVLPRSKGGSNHPQNILPICSTCHAIITRGCTEDMAPRYIACFAHQLKNYGLSFVLTSNLLNSNTSFWVKEYVERMLPIEEVTATNLDKSLRNMGHLEYEVCKYQITQS
jgi:hypothetical protein